MWDVPARCFRQNREGIAQASFRTEKPLDIQTQLGLKVVTVLLSCGFPAMVNFLSKFDYSHAVAKIAQSPCSCQNSMLKERSGNPPFTRRAFHDEFSRRPIFASSISVPRLSPTGNLDFYTVLIGPGYCDTKASMVSSVTPSTVACATKILSKGSL